MEKFDTWRSIASYSVDHELLRKLVDFIDAGIPAVLNLNQPGKKLSDHVSLTIVGSKDSKVHYPISKYTETAFHNDIQLLRLELLYADKDSKGSPQAVALILRLSSSRTDSELAIALQGDKAGEKIKAIEDGLLAVLEPNKNLNSLVYPNEFIPTLIFVIGFFIGIGALMFTPPILKILCVALFGVAIYFVARRFTLGYCSFASRRQRQLNVFLRCLTIGVVLFVLAASVLILQ